MIITQTLSSFSVFFHRDGVMVLLDLYSHITQGRCLCVTYSYVTSLPLLEMTVVSKKPLAHLIVSSRHPRNHSVLTGLTPRFLPESDSLLPLPPTVLALWTDSAGGGERF